MLIELALLILSIISDFFTSFNLIKQLLFINRYSPLLDSDYKAAKQRD
jgi:hypothetical protein